MTRILIAVEDPGAVNFIVELPEALRPYNHQALIFACGPAMNYLKRRGVPFQELDGSNADALLSEHQPCLLLAGTSANLDSPVFELLAAARRQKTTSVGFVDVAGNSAYRFKGRTDQALAHAPDWLIVPDKYAQEAFLKLGYPEQRLIVSGQPHYSYVLEQKQRLSQIPVQELRENMGWRPEPGQTVLVFAAEPLTDFEPDHPIHDARNFSFKSSGNRQERCLIVLEAFLNALAGLPYKPYLVLRLHPKNHPDEFKDYLAAFDAVSWQEPSLDCLFAADALIGSYSIVIFEAALLGHPVLSIVPLQVEETWFDPQFDSAIHRVESPDELKIELDRLLSAPWEINLDTSPHQQVPSRLAAFIAQLCTEPG